MNSIEHKWEVNLQSNQTIILSNDITHIPSRVQDPINKVAYNLEPYSPNEIALTLYSLSERVISPGSKLTINDTNGNLALTITLNVEWSHLWYMTIIISKPTINNGDYIEIIEVTKEKDEYLNFSRIKNQHIDKISSFESHYNFYSEESTEGFHVSNDIIKFAIPQKNNNYKFDNISSNDQIESEDRNNRISVAGSIYNSNGSLGSISVVNNASSTNNFKVKEILTSWNKELDFLNQDLSSSSQDPQWTNRMADNKYLTFNSSPNEISYCDYKEVYSQYLPDIGFHSPDGICTSTDLNYSDLILTSSKRIYFVHVKCAMTLDSENAIEITMYHDDTFDYGDITLDKARRGGEVAGKSSYLVYLRLEDTNNIAWSGKVLVKFRVLKLGTQEGVYAYLNGGYGLDYRGASKTSTYVISIESGR